MEDLVNKILLSILVGIIMAVAFFCCFSRISKRRRRDHFRQIAENKIFERDRVIASQTLPPNEISEETQQQILNSDVTTLRKLLETRQITSKQILVTYYQRARSIGMQNCWITDTLFGEALRQAEECDKAIANGEERAKAPLFGIPISVKDFFNQKGYDATFGLAAKCFAPAADDAIVVRLLKEGGAIPFVRSNVPQASFHVASDNWVFGNALNPYDKQRTTGGSSGGEGGLVAGRCSPIGIATDTVGSLRIPPLWCGVPSFKATPQRISLKGHATMSNRLHGQRYIRNSVGGIGKSMNDFNLLMKVLVSNRAREYGPVQGDIQVVNTEWRENLTHANNKKYRVGYVKSLDIFPASDACIRAVEESLTALRKKGHDVVEVQIPHYDEIVSTTYGILLAEGDAKSLKECMQGERPLDAYGPLLSVTSLPKFVRWTIIKALKLFGERHAAMTLGYLNGATAAEMMTHGYNQLRLFEDFLRMWGDNKLDALILPGTPTPAVTLADAKNLSSISCYCMLHALFNLPGGVLRSQQCVITKLITPSIVSTDNKSMKQLLERVCSTASACL